MDTNTLEKSVAMPKIRCRSYKIELGFCDSNCLNMVRIPPNKAKTATGYCRECYHKRFHNGKRK